MGQLPEWLHVTYPKTRRSATSGDYKTWPRFAQFEPPGHAVEEADPGPSLIDTPAILDPSLPCRGPWTVGKWEMSYCGVIMQIDG